MSLEKLLIVIECMHWCPYFEDGVRLCSEGFRPVSLEKLLIVFECLHCVRALRTA